MSGLDITSLVAGAFGTAKALVPDAFPTVRIRMGRTATVDVVADTSTSTWALDKDVEPVAYGDKNERKNEGNESNLRSFAIQEADLDGNTPTEDAIFIDGDVTWETYRVDRDPTNNLAIFQTKR